jgi:hypothetical protein
MPFCKTCGCDVYVPDGRDFSDGEDDCWDCQIKSLTAERDAWKAQWQRDLQGIAECKKGTAEAIADAIIELLAGWESTKPPRGRLVVVWPIDREPLVARIRWRLEAAIRVRLAEMTDNSVPETTNSQ